MENENKANYETKFSLNEKVLVRKGFYKGTLGKISNVTKDKNDFIYTINVLENIKDKEVETDKKFLVDENLLMKTNSLLLKLFGA